MLVLGFVLFVLFMISLTAQEGLQFTAILLPQPSARITRVHPPHTTPYILESNRPLIVMKAD